MAAASSSRAPDAVIKAPRCPEADATNGHEAEIGQSDYGGRRFKVGMEFKWGVGCLQGPLQKSGSAIQTKCQGGATVARLPHCQDLRQWRSQRSSQTCFTRTECISTEKSERVLGGHLQRYCPHPDDACRRRRCSSGKWVSSCVCSYQLQRNGS